MFDWYGRRARLAPIALAAAPAAALAGGSVAALGEQGSVAAFVLAAVGLVACGIVRDLGLRLQPGLWEQWGGPPTTALLRWRSDNPEVRRRHERIAAITGHTLPTRAEEEADPADADRRYEAALADIRDLTRDQARFPLVAEENADYGFRRNCLGLRPVALSVALAVAVVSVLLIALGSPTERYQLSGLAGVLAALLWWRLVRPDWVRAAADRYATRLIETLATLEGGRK